MHANHFFLGKWAIPFASMIGLVAGFGPAVIFVFSILMQPIGQEFGWDRGETSALLTVANLVTSLSLPLVGKAIDRWGARRVMIPGIVLFAGTMAACSLAPPSLLLFGLLYACMGVAGTVQTPLPYAKTITTWFDEHRGLALGIAMSGVGIGGAVLVQMTQYFVVNWGWRVAYLGIAAIIILIALPIAVLFIREPDRGDTQGCKVASASHDDMTVRQAMRSSRFWSIAVAAFAISAAVLGPIVHLVPLLSDGGLSPAAGATALSAASIAAVFGRLLTGFLLDCFRGPAVGVVVFSIPLIGVFLLGTDFSGATAMVAAVLVGLGLGAEVDLLAYFVSRYFDLKAFGSLYSWILLAFGIGSAIGPLAMGVGFAWLHSYEPLLIAAAALLALSCLLIARLGPYAFQAAGASPGSGSKACQMA